MRVVITHPEMGIYLGSCMGLGFWTLLDPAGQPEAVTFLGAEAARTHIKTWDCANSAADYEFVAVSGCGCYATIPTLIEAGLSHLMGEMEADHHRLAVSTGSSN